MTEYFYTNYKFLDKNNKIKWLNKNYRKPTIKEL